MSQILTLEQIQNMSTDDIINAYRNGHMLKEHTDIDSLNHNIVSAQGISVSTDALILIGIGVLAYMYIKSVGTDKLFHTRSTQQ